jgi:hypothetical protein
VVLSLACNSEPSTRPAAAVFAAQLRDIFTDFKKTPAAQRDGKNGHDGKNGNGVSLLKREASTAATFKIEIPKVEMAKRLTPPPATRAEPVVALKVDMPTAPALRPAPPTEHVEDPVTSPQPIPAVIPFDTTAEAKAEEGEAEMVSSSAAELISGTSEILSGATEVNETLETAAPPPPPAEASEPGAEVAADGELKLPSSLPSGFPEAQSALPSAFPDAPEGEVQLKLAAPSNEAFLIPSSEMVEPVSGNVFGVASEESPSRWKSPMTWLGLAVAVILPITILVVFLTTKSHPAKSAEPAAPSLAATPAPETPKASEPPAPAPSEAKMTKTVAKAPKAKALPVAAAPKAAKAPKAAPVAKASSDEAPAPKNSSAKSADGAFDAPAKSASAKSADGAFDDASAKSDGARKPVTARAPAATGATN